MNEEMTEEQRKRWESIPEEKRKRWEEMHRKSAEYHTALREHEKKIVQTINGIHGLIVENNLSVCDAKLVLDEVVKQVERYSNVIATEDDFVDIHNLLRSGLVLLESPVSLQTKNHH